jgi:hypothetical protein
VSESLREAVAAALKSRQEKQFQADMQLIGHLDPDRGKACTIKDHPLGAVCGQPATYVIRCRQCVMSWLACDAHTAAYRIADQRIDAVMCTACQATGRHLDEIAEFIRIGSTS